MFSIKKADVLPNGARVIDYHISYSYDVTVLCEHTGIQPFVTWKLDESGNAFWGHYFSNASDARTDYFKRSGLHPAPHYCKKCEAPQYIKRNYCGMCGTKQ